MDSRITSLIAADHASAMRRSVQAGRRHSPDRGRWARLGPAPHPAAGFERVAS